MTILYSFHDCARPSQKIKTNRFLERLCRLVDRTEAESFDHIVAWQHHCFVVRQTFRGMLPVLMTGVTQWNVYGASHE
jgi:hypothetical protein